ncbi:hypothetical protein V1517DRAFT_254801 [Lipomyces orientalis]|uniref:Uncharacterized protein n=1 Tax=Lipomyces orientalis TaxID=1233043 RepID=A0ACC3TVP9_9ASCO
MILYGLALRHGWGVKVNTQEAFIWLNKAAGVAAGKASEVNPGAERRRNLCDQFTKESKAQLGLAMYELGVSYLNSWGVGKDERMAVTCFDIGAQLGDPDAMFELASLWCRNGPGRKKDLHKAAALYREATDRGVSAVGNSWIYKEKYSQPKDEKACDSNRECPDGAAVSQKKSLFPSAKKFTNR